MWYNGYLKKNGILHVSDLIPIAWLKYLKTKLCVMKTKPTTRLLCESPLCKRRRGKTSRPIDGCLLGPLPPLPVLDRIISSDTVDDLLGYLLCETCPSMTMAGECDHLYPPQFHCCKMADSSYDFETADALLTLFNRAAVEGAARTLTRITSDSYRICGRRIYS